MNSKFKGSPDPVMEYMINKYSDLSSDFYDCGAFQGRFSVLASPKFKRVFAFEPWEQQLEELRSNTDEFPNIEVVDLALWSEPASMEFHLPNPDRSSLGSLVRYRDDSCYDGRATVIVRCTTIDRFCRLSYPSLIKIDVEGAEIHVLRGAMCTLEERHPPLYIEYHSEGRYRSGDKLLCKLLGYTKVKYVRQNAHVSRAGYAYEK